HRRAFGLDRGGDALFGGLAHLPRLGGGAPSRRAHGDRRPRHGAAPPPAAPGLPPRAAVHRRVLLDPGRRGLSARAAQRRPVLALGAHSDDSAVRQRGGRRRAHDEPGRVPADADRHRPRRAAAGERHVIPHAIAFAVLLLIGVPIAFALGLAGAIGMWAMNLNLITVPTRMVTGIDSVVLPGAPFYTLAGDLMHRGVLTELLVRLTHLITGRIRGCTAYRCL